MTAWKWGALAVVALAATPGIAAENALLGKWHVVEAVPGPWSAAKARPELAAQGRKLIDLEIVFEPRTIVTRHQGLACRRATYEVGAYPPDALFRGALPEGGAERIARDFGLARNEVPSVDVDCGDGHFTYHLRDRNTALFAYDDVVYTLKRR